MPPATELSTILRPLIEAPKRSAIFLDVDGTLAPIVDQPEQARVPENTARLLGRLGRQFAIVACVSGRAATEARRLVGVGSLAYAGYHGAELLMPGTPRPWQLPELEEGADRVRRFGEEQGSASDLRLLRVRLEDKGPIVAFHWRGVPDESAARARVEQVAAAADGEGLRTHWGRKVLEVRPPVEIDKGQAVRRILDEHTVRAALFAGDDRTDLDGFAALEQLRERDRLETVVRVGVISDDGPREIAEQSDLQVDGVAGFAEVLALLAGPAQL